jgi:hypothetical protein
VHQARRNDRNPAEHPARRKNASRGGRARKGALVRLKSEVRPSLGRVSAGTAGARRRRAALTGPT